MSIRRNSKGKTNKISKSKSKQRKSISTSEEQKLKTFEKTIENKYGIELSLWSRFNHRAFLLKEIIVPPEHRGKGIGSTAMKDIIEYADKNNLIIVLTPDSSIGSGKKLSKTKLTAFYKNFGFKMNKGRNKDFTFSELMIRRPK